MLFDAVVRLCAFFDRVVRFAGRSAGWMILPLIATIVFDVVTRKLDITRLWFAELTMTYGYSASTIFQDLEWHFHAVLMMLGFGFAYLANTHVRVDVFRELLSRRKQAWLEVISLLLLGIPFLVVMVYYGWVLFDISWTQDEGSDSLTGLNNRWFIKFFIPLGFLMTLFALLATLGRLVVFLFGSAQQQRLCGSQLAIFRSAEHGKPIFEEEKSPIHGDSQGKF